MRKERVLNHLIWSGTFCIIFHSSEGVHVIKTDCADWGVSAVKIVVYQTHFAENDFFTVIIIAFTLLIPLLEYNL